MPQLTLSYFSFPGRASGIRKTLALSGVPFEDEQFPREEHAARKPSQPYGKVPTLTVDGQVIAETQAILRYVAQVGGLYPPSSEQLACLMVDEILDTFVDLFERAMRPSYIEQDPDKIQQLRQAMVQGPFPDALQLIENRLEQISEYPFFKNHSDSVFVHEVVVWDHVEFFLSGRFTHVPTEIVKKYKMMMAIYDKIEQRPRVEQRSMFQLTAAPAVVIPAKLKLTYFDITARAEKIRLALYIGGVDFEDERISLEEFTKRKPLLPNAQVPVLEVGEGGIVCAQSFAILRYAGRLTRLYPVNNILEAAKIDELMSHVDELYATMADSFKQHDPEKKRVLREQLAARQIPESLSGLDKRIVHWQTPSTAGSVYAVGGQSLSIADLVIFTMVEFFHCGLLEHVSTVIIDPYKTILRVHEAVQNHPRVVDWYNKHPATAPSGSA